MPKKNDFKKTKEEKDKLSQSIEVVSLYLSELALIWPDLTAKQQYEYIKHSPLFKDLLDLVKPFMDI